jgi:multiple sugar transport system substrate-binding protein
MTRLRRGGLLAAASLTAAALVATGCTPSAPSQTVASAGVTASGTIEFWHFFSDREAEAIQKAVDAFQAKFPLIKVTVKSGQDDSKTTQAIAAGQGPDVALSGTTDNVGKFCSTGAWQDLGPYISRDKVDMSDIPNVVQSYTAHQDKRCTMPLLADAYGLYYNKKLFAAAGISSPPKTLSELAADAKKLTQKDASGNLKVAGFDPLSGFYENSVTHYAAMAGAKFLKDDGKSAVGSDPQWKELLNWQKSLVDYYGYDKINKFQSAFGDEFSADNAFEKGQVAMNIDGEWRIANIAADNPEGLEWGVAPMPLADSRADAYGSGFLIGNVIGISKNSKNAEAAWQFIKYMTTNTDAVVNLANAIKNVPTLKSALKSPNLSLDPNFKTFLDVFANPKSATSPLSAAGTAYQDTMQTFVNDWQAGKVSDLGGGLSKLDSDINTALGG